MDFTVTGRADPLTSETTAHHISLIKRPIRDVELGRIDPHRTLSQRLNLPGGEASTKPARMRGRRRLCRTRRTNRSTAISAIDARPGPGSRLVLHLGIAHGVGRIVGKPRWRPAVIGASQSAGLFVRNLAPGWSGRLTPAQAMRLASLRRYRSKAHVPPSRGHG